jgi:hypothetical protein
MQPNHLTQTIKAPAIQTFFQTKEAKDLGECTFKPFVSENSKQIS